MTRRALLTALSLAALAPEGQAGAPAAPARDGDIAIREELDAARRAGTRAAYDLFLARHPGHPLSEAARRERDRLPGAAGGAKPHDR